MSVVFSALTIADVDRPLFRNTVAPLIPERAFGDLSSSPDDWVIADALIRRVPSSAPRSASAVITDPFDDARWAAAVGWPFRHWRASRFSDGLFGVWYGADSFDTAACESAWHWLQGLLADAGFDHGAVVSERHVYTVACRALLLDFTAAVDHSPELRHPPRYDLAQTVGARLHHEGHPGLLLPSVRRPEGQTFAIFTPVVLSAPMLAEHCIYRLLDDGLVVERTSGSLRLRRRPAGFSVG
jgi:hypothetical protein